MKEYQFIPLSHFEDCAQISVLAESECFSLLFHSECSGKISPAYPMRIIN